MARTPFRAGAEDLILHTPQFGGEGVDRLTLSGARREFPLDLTKAVDQQPQLLKTVLRRCASLLSHRPFAAARQAAASSVIPAPASASIPSVCSRSRCTASASAIRRASKGGTALPIWRATLVID